jgi:hypothetical protein
VPGQREALRLAGDRDGDGVEDDVDRREGEGAVVVGERDVRREAVLHRRLDAGAAERVDEGLAHLRQAGRVDRGVGDGLRTRRELARAGDHAGDRRAGGGEALDDLREPLGIRELGRQPEEGERQVQVL